MTPSKKAEDNHVPAPDFTSLPIRSKAREKEKKQDSPAREKEKKPESPAREEPVKESAAKEWDFLPKVKPDDDQDIDSDGSGENPSELPTLSQAGTLQTSNTTSSPFTRSRTYYDGEFYTGNKGNTATCLKAIQDKFGKRVQDLLDRRLHPHRDPFRWNPKMLRLLLKVVKECRDEEQLHEVLWFGVKSQKVVQDWENAPLTRSMLVMAYKHLEVEYNSKPARESDEEDGEEEQV